MKSQLETLFIKFKQYPPGDDRDRLVMAADLDPSLASELLSLLQASDQAQGFLSISPFNQELVNSKIEDPIEIQFGPYRITKKLGEGGMGIVYAAERSDGKYNKTVAVKILRRHAHNESQLLRFFAERQMLANLEHPNIARLIDGNETEDGQPYLVMEYVDGVNVVEYCSRAKLSIRDKLLLFKQICDAIEFAHQHNIIHRDIKPSNILVNKDGWPKLLDFGIAKYLSMDAYGLPLTMPEGVVLTPEYAAPEQLNGQEVSTTSDVYSLGVVLYEMLTERLPYDLPSSGIFNRLNAIAECKIRPPSIYASANQSRQIRGSLDKIVLRALSKDSTVRYQRAGDLASDIHDYLENNTNPSFNFSIPRVINDAGKKFNKPSMPVWITSILFFISITLLVALNYEAWSEGMNSSSNEYRSETKLTEGAKNVNYSDDEGKKEVQVAEFSQQLEQLRRSYSSQPFNRRLQISLAKKEYLYSLAQAAAGNLQAAIHSTQRCIDTMDKNPFGKRLWRRYRFNCALSKAHWYNVAGEAEQAKRLIDDAMLHIKGTEGEGWVPMFRVYEERSQYYALIGQFDDALSEQKKCVEFLKNKVVVNSKFKQALAYAYQNLGTRYQQIANPKQAHSAFTKAIALWRSELEQSPDLSAGIVNLSDSLAQSAEVQFASADNGGSNKQACDELREASKLAQKAKTINDPFVLRQYNIPRLNQLNNRFKNVCRTV